MGQIKYRLSYKEIKNPDGDLSDPDNIQITTDFFDTKKEAEEQAEAVLRTAGMWDPKIDGPYEMDE